MKYNPHDYQKYAIRFIEDHPIAAILLDMGMGKSSITLTVIQELMYDSFDVTKVLIIAPLRVAKNTWSAEIEKWDHLHGLTCSIAVGTAAERKAALKKEADIYIINREYATIKSTDELIQNIFAPYVEKHMLFRSIKKVEKH